MLENTNDIRGGGPRSELAHFSQAACSPMMSPIKRKLSLSEDLHLRLWGPGKGLGCKNRTDLVYKSKTRNASSEACTVRNM